MDEDLEATHRRVKAEYPGEDTRLTSKKELAGWYAYGFAAEVFVICGMGRSSFLVLRKRRCGKVFDLTVVAASCYLGGWANGQLEEQQTSQFSLPQPQLQTR